jgi:hypothetical protein
MAGSFEIIIKSGPKHKLFETLPALQNYIIIKVFVKFPPNLLFFSNI